MYNIKVYGYFERISSCALILKSGESGSQRDDLIPQETMQILEKDPRTKNDEGR